ncbi:MAG: SUMF1/EgtB/PvdO family nonheme iron enzyme [Hyphomicrobiaceae bacterium]|nr:SUMF1/EgtB/PvdO family nonheme iron enzyme [Hyphomicrobiaceae bacterium]
MTERRALSGGLVLDGKYRIDRVIGMGGFGITYAADHVALQRLVAIKEYFPADIATRDGTGSVRVRQQKDRAVFEHMRESILKEARALGRFDHPAIVRVLSVFEQHGTVYIVMPFENGPSLKAWLRDLGRSPTAGEVERIAAPLLDALEIIHADHYLHRDIAPDNIILRADGSPVLIDFGAARPVMSALSASITGIVKRGFSPPEQYSTDSRSQGPWTDIYALAGTLYQCVTGSPPPDATERLLEDAIRPAAALAAGQYPLSLLEGIDWAMQLKPKDRPQSIAAWRPRLLARHPASPGRLPAAGPAGGDPSDVEGPTSTPTPGRWRSRRGLAAAFATIAVLGLAGTAILALWRPGEAPLPPVQRPAGPPTEALPAPPSAEPTSSARPAPASVPAPSGTPSPQAPEERTPQPSPPASSLIVDTARRTFRDCPTCPEMVVVPSGTFLMGSPASELGRRDDEGPQRSITITRPFGLARTETTRGEWRAFTEATQRPVAKDCRIMQDTPDRASSYEVWLRTASWGPTGRHSWEDTGYSQDDRHPAACISYGDAEAYLGWLASRTGAAYRLPSEAEWEYAARAGTPTAFAFGDNATPRDASYYHPLPYRAGGEQAPWRNGTMPVASFPANAYGLHDMHGNVWEWVADCSGGELGSLDAVGAPRQGPPCESAGMRGGAFWTQPAWMRSAFRYSYQKDRRGAAAGFRAVRVIRDDELPGLQSLLGAVPAPGRGG